MSDRPNAPRDFKAALRRADAEQPALSPEAEKRLRARIEATIEGPPRPAWLSWPVLVGSLGVAAAVALVVFSPAAPREVGGFQLAERSADVRVEAGGQVALAPSVVVTDHEGGRVESLEASLIQANSQGFRVLSGVVRVSVTKRAAGAAPYEVAVSSGSIRVLGTAFTIEERGDRGAVTLHEGRIQFTHADGFTETLTPGQRTTWPHVVAPVEPAPAPVPAPEPVAPLPTPTDPAPPPTPAPAAPPPAHTPTPLPAPTEPLPTPAPAPPVATLTAEELRIETLRADAVLTKVSGLRSRGRFDDAVTALDAALADAYAPSTRERLSFEQLSILAFQLHDAARTCDALRRHLATFGPGRYADGLDQVRAEHACAKP